ncbi:MAG: DUF2975 domain-containing protein [Vagococcus sp.]|uniref:DUF2975 domain-containing protein n=1 Tax=Vagococcus sp. TaxID=1933889 RepID=UPI002FCBCBB3
MSIKQINVLFKGLIFILGISGIGLLLIIAPEIASNIVLILFWLTAIPVFLILANLWKISSHLLKETLFSEKNSLRLNRIAYFSLVESTIYALAIMLGFISFKENYPYFFICLFFFFLGITLAVIAALLSYIFKLANQLKKENDLTI